MARGKRRKISQVSMDLTPMIDVVFQLIIFFILTMTITTLTVKKVELPIAETAVEEDTEADAYMVHLYNASAVGGPQGGAANLNPDGWHIALPNQEMEYRTVQELSDPLTQVAEDYNNRTGELSELGLSKMILLIRGDMRCPSHYFSVVLQACIAAKIQKIRVSIKPPRNN